MNKLKQMWMDKLKEMKDPYADQDLNTTIYYPTGFDELDYRNGTVTKVTDLKTNEIVDEYLQVGVAGGSMNGFIGPSGSGKTALAVQAAFKGASTVPGSLIMHYDAEKATDISRLIKLSGRDAAYLKEMYIKKEAGISTESFFNQVKAHADAKLAMKNDIMYDTGKMDEFNQPLKAMIPTFIILDSLANLMPEKNIDEEGTGTNMTAAQIAKGNSNIFKKIIPLLSQANIVLSIINHIGVAIQISMMQPVKKQVNYMKQGETLPGGGTVIYLCNNIFKLEAKSAFKEDDKYKIDGFITTLTIIKSRSNRAGQQFEMVFSDGGFSQLMSKFHMAKNHDIVKGAAFLEIEGYPTKFRNSNFSEKYITEPAFREAFDKACQPLLDSFARGTGNSAISQASWVELLEKDIEIPEGVSLKEIQAA